jgi:hypothetical protein
LGHLLVDDFITETREDAFAAAIVDDIETITEQQLVVSNLSHDENLRRAVRDQLIGRNLRLATRFWRRGLEELLSDVAGAILFGPAALFSTFEMALQQGYDTPPEERNNYYPPWRYRMRRVLATVEHQGGWLPVPKSLFSNDESRTTRVLDRVDAIRRITLATNDHEGISPISVAQVVYNRLESDLKQGEAYLLQDRGLSTHLGDPKKTYERLAVLIERLDHRIPPNAFQDGATASPLPLFVEIINAAWFHKVSQPLLEPGSIGSVEDAIQTRNRTNNLVLKAIEYAHLSASYAAGR